MWSFSWAGKCNPWYRTIVYSLDQSYAKNIFNEKLEEFISSVENTDDILEIFKIDSYIILDCEYKELLAWHKNNTKEYYCQDSLQTFDDLIKEFNKISLAA